MRQVRFKRNRDHQRSKHSLVNLILICNNNPKLVRNFVWALCPRARAFPPSQERTVQSWKETADLSKRRGPRRRKTKIIRVASTEKYIKLIWSTLESIWIPARKSAILESITNGHTASGETMNHFCLQFFEKLF